MPDVPDLCDFRPREPRKPPRIALSCDEAILTRLFLRRYATWCARSGHYDPVESVGPLSRRLGAKLAR